MGRSKNPDVVLDLSPSDKAAANRLGVFDNNGKVFAFAQVQSDQDNLSYVVIAKNHKKGKPLREFLEAPKPYKDEDPLRNVREAFQKARPEGDVQIRSCCNFSKNVTVLLVGRDGEEWSTVTLLDRFVKAEFNGPPTPKTPILALNISTKRDKSDKTDKEG